MRVEVAAVIGLVGVVPVAVVVHLGNLVPAVQQGNARLQKHHGVEGQIKAGGSWILSTASPRSMYFSII